MLNKKIGFITIYSSKGSSHSQESALAWYSKSLILGMDEKIRQKLVVFSNIKNAKQIFIEDEVEINECWQRGSIFFVKQIIENIKKYSNLKVIHLQHEFNLFGGPLSMFMYLWLLRKLKKTGKKIIVTYHGVISQNIIDKNFGKINQLRLPAFLIKFFFNIIYKFSFRYIEKIIVHEDYFKKILIKEYNCSFKKIEVIPIGVDTINFKMKQEEAREKINIPQNKNIILFFGFLSGYKGVDILINAFRLLNPDKYFLILGGGKPKRVENDSKYNKWHDLLMKKIDKNSNILKTGFITDDKISTYFYASDVLIMPYLQVLASSGPMSLAIAHNKPFLVSNVFQGVVKNESSIFDLDYKALASKIEKFFEDKHQFDGYIESLRKERLWTNIGQKTENIYRDLSN